MSRAVRRGLIALVVVALWLSGSYVMRSTSAESTGPASAPESSPRTETGEPVTEQAPPTQAPAKAVADIELGVQLSAHHGSRTRYARQVMAELAEAGAGWVRVDVGWATLQTTGPGAFDQWYVDLIDDVLASARDHDLKVILMLWLTPSWASPTGSLYAPPTEVDAYANAISRAADRWGHLVDAWEIWNEPNFDTFFHGADPAVYTDLLCAAYPAVKKHDQSPVLFGGVMYNDDQWVRRAYEAGAGNCFDVLATHPYVGPSDAAPDTPAVGEVWRLTHTPAMRAVMDEWGDDGKPIWITELGWSTGVDNGGNAWDRPVTPRRQARFLRDAVSLIRSEYPYVGPIIWYRDVDGPSNAYQDGFGLMRPSLSPKPAMSAFKKAVAGR